jgi:hypothetical protein
MEEIVATRNLCPSSTVLKYCNTVPFLLRNVKELKEEFRTAVFSAVIHRNRVAQV